MSAPVAYPLYGLHVGLAKAVRGKRHDAVTSARIEQGRVEYAESSAAEAQKVVALWVAMQHGAAKST